MKNARIFQPSSLVIMQVLSIIDITFFFIWLVTTSYAHFYFSSFCFHRFSNVIPGAYDGKSQEATEVDAVCWVSLNAVKVMGQPFLSLGMCAFFSRLVSGSSTCHLCSCRTID